MDADATNTVPRRSTPDDVGRADTVGSLTVGDVGHFCKYSISQDRTVTRVILRYLVQNVTVSR